MQTPMKHSFQLEHPNFLYYFFFFLPYVFPLHFNAPCFLLQLCQQTSGIVSYHRAYSTFRISPSLTLLHEIFFEQLKTALSYMSLVLTHSMRLPISHKHFLVKKKRIFLKTSFNSLVENGNLVTEPRKKSLVLSFMVKFSIDEYTLSPLMDHFYYFAAQSAELAAMHLVNKSVSRSLLNLLIW